MLLLYGRHDNTVSLLHEHKEAQRKGELSQHHAAGTEERKNLLSDSCLTFLAMSKIIE